MESAYKPRGGTKWYGGADSEIRQFGRTGRGVGEVYGMAKLSRRLPSPPVHARTYVPLSVPSPSSLSPEGIRGPPMAKKG